VASWCSLSPLRWGGATVAYFSDSDESGNNTFATGTLAINVDQTTNSYTTAFTNMAPSDVETVRFDVVNTGSLPVNIRGYAVGSWNTSGLDDTIMKVTKVEYYNGGWQTLAGDGTYALTGEYYYSDSGTASGTMMELAAGATENFRLTVEFDSSADNSYQGKTYTSQVHVDAKQIAASWN
jgi:predicted ribosomally synthesized peptide with SipW-like signal peptide